jgi:toluene monooxygenase system ferredoxin subunit
METAMTARWRAAMHIDDLWEGDIVGVSVDDEPVLLVNVDGDVHAYSNKCPHQQSPLDEGDLDGAKLTCVKHMWEFDARTGCGINPDDAHLRSFGCRVDDAGEIHVDIGR